jgi:ribosomal-protein-alanine N-acetyltransferase
LREGSDLIRPANRGDLEALEAIERESPGSAGWAAEAYLGYDCRVAEQDGQVVAFLVVRRVAPDEAEILNVAVAPAARRRGWARRLIGEFLSEFHGTCWLEVRESNAAARSLYDSIGFRVAGARPEYYASPPESAVVMTIQTCYREGRRTGMNG